MSLRATIEHFALQLLRLYAFFEYLRDLCWVNAFRTRSPAEIHSTAIHEAGHAVALLALGLGVVAVSIVPDLPSQTAGYVVGGKYTPARGLDMAGRQGFFLRRAMSYYAGAEAVRQLIPTDPNPDAGASSDTQKAAELLIHEIGGNAEYVEFLFSLAKRRCALLVAHYQPEIQALAVALKEKRILSGRVARKVFLKSLTKRSGQLMTFQTDHTFHGLVGDVAFRAFLRKLNLPGRPH